MFCEMTTIVDLCKLFQSCTLFVNILLFVKCSIQGNFNLQSHLPLFSVLPPSSWYDVDYSVASPLRFGQCLGCDFAEKSCFSYGWVGDL